DIDGLGEKIIDKLVESGRVRSVADLYYLTEKDLVPLERMAEKSVSNILAAIDASRRPTLDRLIYALGIRHVGEHVAKVLARAFGSVERLRAAGEDELTRVPEIGPQIARSIRGFFGQKANTAVLKRLAAGGVRWTAPSKADGSGPLEGKTVVLTGALQTLTREEAGRLVGEAGGRASSSVSAKTDYVVAGADPGSKYEKAKKLGIAILTETEFMKLLGKR
ncbi:MAG: helix-hairpin-helix domain-containing protein, partial [Candidatus Aureabacteria bacterium]|nr:helix-hairpin-helix domain-containing protein [Candidatus Auribacterota bacterium]